MESGSVYKQKLVNTKLQFVEGEVKNRDDWEKNIKETNVLIEMPCHLGRRSKEEEEKEEEIYK